MYRFFFNDAATTEIYTLSLHDALPIYGSDKTLQVGYANHFYRSAHKFEQIYARSEERFSRNAETELVCRLLLEKKKYYKCYYITNIRTFSVIDSIHVFR